MKKGTQIFIVIILTVALGAIFFVYNRTAKLESEKWLIEHAQTNASSDFVEEKEIETGKLYVTRQGNDIKVISKYNDEQDIEIVWGENGANNIFNFKTLGLIGNTNEEVSNKRSSEIMLSPTTDFFGPHKILALENADGDMPDSIDFTGGNHAYDGGGNTGQTTTGRTTEVKLLVDGVEVNEYGGYGDEITISWENYIQASNTKKEDGQGREVLVESFEMTFNGEDYKVNAEIEFLEDVNWVTYYGLQALYGNFWNDSITYFDENESTYSALESATSSSIYTDKISLNNGSDYLDIEVDNTIGLGTRNYLNGIDYGAMNIESTQKAYFWLVNDAYFDAGEVVNYSGKYRFYSE